MPVQTKTLVQPLHWSILTMKHPLFLTMTATAVMFTLVSIGSLVSFASVVNNNPKIWPMWIFCLFAAVAGVVITSASYRKYTWGKMFCEL